MSVVFQQEGAIMTLPNSSRAAVGALVLVLAHSTSSLSVTVCTSSYHVVASLDTPGESRGVALQGDYLYVGDAAAGLHVVDISNTQSPHIVGTLPIYAWEVVVSGSYAYASSYGILRVVDISDPTTPVERGSLPGGGNQMQVVGNHVYVAAGTAGLQIVDVSDPDTPVQVGSVPTIYALDVAVGGSYAYVAADFVGVHVIDVSNPEAPGLVTTYNSPGQNFHLALVGNYLYAHNGQVGLEVIDVSVPSAPTFVTSLPQSFNDIAVDGNAVYLSQGGIAVLDASAPASPQVVDRIYMDYFSYALEVRGENAYALRSGYGVVDVVDLAPPNLVVGSVDTPGTASGVDVAGGYAYVADGASGLQIVDISTPTSPQILGNVPGSSGLGDVVLAGNYAYAVGSGRLMILDVSQPSTPNPVLNWNNSFLDIAITGSRMYVSATDVQPYNPITAYDVTSPASPQYLGFIDTPGFPQDIAAAGNYVYVAEAGTLQIVDFSVPSSPFIVGSVPTPGGGWSVALVGQYACVASGSAGMHVIDVSVPSAPAIVATVPTFYEARDVDIVDGRAYVMQAPTYRMDVIDLTVPSHPGVLASIDAPATPLSAVRAGSYVYVTASDRGLMVYPEVCVETTAIGDESAPSASRLGRIRRDGSSLQIQYAIGTSTQNAQLAIYDVVGRRVRTLYRGRHEPGSYLIGWDGRTDTGRPSASGVYFVRLDVDSRSDARKALWLH